MSFANCLMFVPFWALLHAQGDEGGVSEYAKWMDAKGAEEAGNEAATEDKTVVDYVFSNSKLEQISFYQ